MKQLLAVILLGATSTTLVAQELNNATFIENPGISQDAVVAPAVFFGQQIESVNHQIKMVDNQQRLDTVEHQCQKQQLHLQKKLLKGQMSILQSALPQAEKGYRIQELATKTQVGLLKAQSACDKEIFKIRKLHRALQLQALQNQLQQHGRTDGSVDVSDQ